VDIRRGIFEDVLDVTGSQAAQGEVLGGAHVRARALLLVQGEFRGDATVDAGAELIVQGKWHGQIVANLGKVMLQGELELDLSKLPGRIIVGADSELHLPDGDFDLQRDGTLTPAARESLTFDNQSTFCVWNQDRGVFEPA